MQHNIILVLSGLLGGIINSIAGGGGILMYPAFLAVGLNPITASATISMVIWPGSISSAYGYRKELKKVPKSYLYLLIPCALGAVIGSLLLISTDPSIFKTIAPWLVLSAVILLAVQSKIHRWLSFQNKKRKIHWHTMPIIYATIFPLAIYGGFFGVGVGLLVLVALGFTKLNGSHQLNGVKNLCAMVIAFVAMINLSRAGLINFYSGAIMASGALIGGYIGAKLAHKVSAHIVHDITVIVGLFIAIYLIVTN